MTTTNTDPEAIRRDIDRTRERLSEDVDVLAESVRPGSVAKRTAQRATSRAGRLKESVMGSAHDVTQAGSDTVHSASDTVMAAPDLARRQARGNPLAAGAVALAAGWLVGSLLPASEKERQLAWSAKEHAQPLVDEASSLAKETAQHLKEPAQQAAQSVKETAREAADHVREEGEATAQGVAGSSGSNGGTSSPGTSSPGSSPSGSSPSGTF
jgi:ElaB/YqjD/DUF883 family membrane-anchored ribosome-binding protein